MNQAKDHSFIKWGGGFLSVMALIVSAVIYLENIRSGFETNQLLLKEIQDTQAQHFAQRENRFEEIEVGQRNIKDQISTSQDDLFFHVGELSGRLLERDNSAIDTTHK